MQPAKLVFPPFLTDTQQLKPADNTALFETTGSALKSLLELADRQFWQLLQNNGSFKHFLNTYLQYGR